MFKVALLLLVCVAFLCECSNLDIRGKTFEERDEEEDQKKILKSDGKNIGTAALLSGLALAALYSGRKAYNSYLADYTHKTLEGVAHDLHQNIDRTSNDMLTVMNVLESKKQNWADLADKIRGLVKHQASSTLLLYLDNMFPAVSNYQADSFNNPTDVVQDMNSEHLSTEVVEDIVSNMLDNLGSTLINSVGDDLDEQLGALGYKNASAAITNQLMPMLTLITNLYKASITLGALVADTQNCLAQMDYAASEAHILGMDARWSLCDMLRQLRVHTKIHRNMHVYMLTGGDVLPSQEAMDLWDELTRSIEALDNELDTIWNRGWCDMFPDTRLEHASNVDCLGGTWSNERWYCNVNHVFMDDEFQDHSQRYAVDVRHSMEVFTDGWVYGTHDLHEAVTVARAPGTMNLDYEIGALPPVTQLVVVTEDTRYTKPLEFVGLFEQRSFVPTMDMVYADKKFFYARFYLEQLTREAMSGTLHNYIAANFYRAKDNMQDNASWQVYLMQSRGGGAPVAEVKFCSSSELGNDDGWYRVHMASTDPKVLCPEGTSLTDGSWTSPKHLCYRKEWSMAQAITDAELSESEKYMWNFLLESAQNK